MANDGNQKAGQVKSLSLSFSSKLIGNTWCSKKEKSLVLFELFWQQNVFVRGVSKRWINDLFAVKLVFRSNEQIHVIFSLYIRPDLGKMDN